MMRLYALNIEETIDYRKYNFFMNCVSNSKKEKINKFCFVDDKKRSLYSDVLVRHLICKKLNINNSKIKFYTNKYGKPYLSQNNELYFNIAHSGKWILVGFSNSELGVDIEYIDDCKLDIAKCFFTIKEYENLNNTPIVYQAKLFYDLWCLKESYIKYKGLGLSINLNSFETKVGSTSSAIFTNNDEKIYAKNYIIDSSYCTASCSTEKPTDKITYITLDEIWKHMN